MACEIRVRPTQNEDELKLLAEVTADAFLGDSEEESLKWIGLIGEQHMRVVTVDGVVAGGCGVIPSGQYFGGRSLSTAGIGGVAIFPEFRAGGAATALMRSVIEEQHAAGVVLSTLYPATIKLYRRAGYELAGETVNLRIPVRLLDARDRSLSVRRIAAADEPTVEQLYRTTAVATNGNLDRGPFHWYRVRVGEKRKPNHGYLIEDGEQAVGYVYWVHRHNQATQASEIVVTDWAATTAAAARRILTLIADHRTVRRYLVCQSQLADPLFLTLGEWQFDKSKEEAWMLRILNVPQALGQRGYSRHVTAELNLAITDDWLPSNAGAWRVRVADGTATVEPGGAGTLQLDVRALAAVFGGTYNPRDLARIGAVTGPAEEVDALAAIFAGPRAWLRDWF